MSLRVSGKDRLSWFFGEIKHQRFPMFLWRMACGVWLAEITLRLAVGCFVRKLSGPLVGNRLYRQVVQAHSYRAILFFPPFLTSLCSTECRLLKNHPGTLTVEPTHLPLPSSLRGNASLLLPQHQVSTLRKHGYVSCYSWPPRILLEPSSHEGRIYKRRGGFYIPTRACGIVSSSTVTLARRPLHYAILRRNIGSSEADFFSELPDPGWSSRSRSLLSPCSHSSAQATRNFNGQRMVLCQ